MPDWVKTALVSFLSGGALVALIGLYNDRWKFKANRQAIKEDRAEERADKVAELSKQVEALGKVTREKHTDFDQQIGRLMEMQSAQSEALKVILLDRILHLGQKYIAAGAISFDDRKRLHEMHDRYHVGLDGNGDADLIMDGVDELPLVK